MSDNRIIDMKVRARFDDSAVTEEGVLGIIVSVEVFGTLFTESETEAIMHDVKEQTAASIARAYGSSAEFVENVSRDRSRWEH